MNVVNELLGFLVMIFVAILMVAGAVAVVLLGLLMPLMLPILLLGFPVLACLFNLSEHIREITK